MSLIEKTTGDFTVSRGSSGTRVYSSGLLQTITDTDAPRLDYTFGGAPSVLLEPQRQNQVKYSEDFNSWNNKTGVAVSDGVTSPDGSTLSKKLYVTSTGTNSEYYLRQLSFVYTLNTNYTYSVFAKKAELNFLRLRMFTTNGDSGRAEEAYFNLENGTVGYTGINVSNAKMEDCGNGWYRCSYTIPSGSTTSNQLIDIAPAVADQNRGGTAQQNKGIYIYGAQAEVGSYLTSYISTSGTPVTRSREIINNGGVEETFNLNEGTLYFHGKVDEDFDGLGFLRLRSRDGKNWVELYFQTSNIFVREKVNNTWTGSNQLNDKYIKGEFFKLAVTYNKNGTRKGYQNGTQLFSATNSGDFTANNSGLRYIGFDGGSNDLEIKGVYYFDRALTDAELEKLTSSDITQVLASYNNRAQYLGAFYESSHVQTKLNELF
jgi:hypothetical protein